MLGLLPQASLVCYCYFLLLSQANNLEQGSWFWVHPTV